jgi:hypothetical protein
MCNGGFGYEGSYGQNAHDEDNTQVNGKVYILTLLMWNIS